MKEAKDKYTKKVASPFILAESSVMYRPPPEGFYGSFGAKEKNVRPDPVHIDDDWDDADGGETSSSCEIVKIKKPKKGFIENEVVFTDDEMDIDSTLKNNIGENLEKVQEDDLNISKLMDSSDKDEVFDTDKKIQEMRSTYKGIFMEPDVCDRCDVNSKRDVHSLGDSLSSPPPTHIGGMKIDIRVLDLEKKHCRVPGWRGRSIFPIDNRGSGEHRAVIQKMTTGTTKDRQLLEVLEEVITRNKEEYEIDDGNNEDIEGERV